DPLDHATQKPRAILERTAVRTFASACAKQLVTEIAVTLLDVDEREARIAREPGCRDEIVGESIEVLVAQHANAGGKSRVERGMMPGRKRFWTVVRVRPSVAA